MASPVSRLYESRRKSSKRRRKWQGMGDIFSDLGAISIFAGGKLKKAQTAWEEYESGYKELGGDPDKLLERPGFFKQLGQSLVPGGDKGFFQMPEGEVKINDKMYDMKEIGKLGKFIKSELGIFAKGRGYEDMIKKGLAPGRLATEEDIYKDIAERFNLDPSEVVAGGVSSKQPYASEIDVKTGPQHRAKIQDYSEPIRSNGELQTPAWEPPRDVESGDVARMKGKEFYEKDYYTGLSEWDYLLKKKNLWDSKNENNKNRKEY